MGPRILAQLQRREVTLAERRKPEVSKWRVKPGAEFGCDKCQMPDRQSSELKQWSGVEGTDYPTESSGQGCSFGNHYHGDGT